MISPIDPDFARQLARLAHFYPTRACVKQIVTYVRNTGSLPKPSLPEYCHYRYPSPSGRPIRILPGGSIALGGRFVAQNFANDSLFNHSGHRAVARSGKTGSKDVGAVSTRGSHPCPIRPFPKPLKPRFSAESRSRCQPALIPTANAPSQVLLRVLPRPTLWAGMLQPVRSSVLQPVRFATTSTFATNLGPRRLTAPTREFHRPVRRSRAGGAFFVARRALVPPSVTCHFRVPVLWPCGPRPKDTTHV